MVPELGTTDEGAEERPGVSGGYQSARRGSSIFPGGDSAAIQRVLPILEKVAAKAEDRSPCVAPTGPGGTGHFVKMVHNGIEQAMMGAMLKLGDC
ncbi:hypothetical protein BC629DRAFT_1111161 [Irpex lacteus]|nr:hypothetical protein BC629DRAFT_1111161 [Irpex lacteus]